MFIALEDDNDPLHVASTLIFEGGPLRRSDGEIDRMRIESTLADAVESLPRLRECVLPGRVFRRPRWIDDPEFDLSRHLDCVTLPPPGSDAALREVVSEFQSKRLRRDRPLWSMLVIDGLEQGRIAMAIKVHHAVLDGISGVGSLVTMLHPPSRSNAKTQSPRRRGISGMFRLAHAMARPERRFAALRGTLRRSTVGLLQAARVVTRPAPPTILNPTNTSARRLFGWTSVDMEQLRRIGHAAGGTLNDAALAVTAGALRRFLLAAGESPAHLAMRVLVPVSTHRRQDDKSGNAVSILMAPLPADEPDPRRRLEKVVAATRKAKGSHQADGIALGEQLADWTSPRLLSGLARFGFRLRPFNLIVTNVPGPDEPLDMAGARLLEAYPLVPLYGNQAIGIALLSYAGRLFWGLNADRERISDLTPLVEAIEESFVELRDSVLVRDP